jgi:hypothetical protein
MVNLDFALQLLCESLQVRLKFVEKYLQGIFVEGDENGDGVLSFKEFTVIVKKVAPHFNERRVLKMFREALMTGSDNESIGPLSFVNVCKKHGLIQLVDLHSLRKLDNECNVASVVDARESSHSQLIRDRAEAAELAIKATAIMQSKMKPNILRRASTIGSLSPVTQSSLKHVTSLASVARRVSVMQKFSSTLIQQPQMTLPPTKQIITSHSLQEPIGMDSSNTLLPTLLPPPTCVSPFLKDVQQPGSSTNSDFPTAFNNSEALSESEKNQPDNVPTTPSPSSVGNDVVNVPNAAISMLKIGGQRENEITKTAKRLEAIRQEKNVKTNEELSSQKKETVIMQLKLRREARKGREF